MGASAQSDSLVVVEDLSLRLLQLDKSDELVLNTDISESGVLGFYVEMAEPFDQLKLCGSVPFSVWLDGRLIVSQSKCVAFEKASLFAEEKNAIFFTIVSDKQFSNLQAMLLSFRSYDFELTNLPTERKTHDFQEWLIIALLIISLGAGIIKLLSPALFKLLFTVNLGASRKDGLIGEFSLETLLGTVFVSLMVAFVYAGASLMEDDTEAISNWLIFANWLKIAFYVLVGMLIKYVLLSVIAWLNDIPGVVNLQFHDFLKFFSVSSLLLMIILGLYYWLGYYGEFHVLKIVTNVWVVVYLIFMIYLFIKLDSWTHCKKLHIISYLCTTEFIGAFLIALIIYK
jgi:hypothetical protein